MFLSQRYLGILLTISFIGFNLVPDVVFMIHGDDQTIYYVVAIAWSTGYLIDPLVYIFASKDSRDVARSSIISVSQRIGERLSLSLMILSRRSTLNNEIPEVNPLDLTEKHGQHLHVPLVKHRCTTLWFNHQVHILFISNSIFVATKIKKDYAESCYEVAMQLLTFMKHSICVSI